MTALAALTALSLLLGQSAALGHTNLVASDPADGVQLTAPPTDIGLTFGADISDQFVTVLITIGDQAPQELVSCA